VNARAEAHERLGSRYEVRVLEPSPPAIAAPPWFADDPVARAAVPDGRQLVSPIVGEADLTWDELASGDPELAAWCAARWLGAYRRLGPAPRSLVGTRLALHRLAERVLSPARAQANGKIGLRFTRGGVGTPFFGDDVQLRVEGAQLVVQTRAGEQRSPITTLAAAADAVGRTLLPDALAVDDEPLDVDPTAGAFLGDWFGFGASVLEQLRAEAAADERSRVQLWPEHFDIAVELGAEAAGARAAYGASPGDADHPEPYLYVAPWTAPAPSDLWQASGFTGAELPFADLLAAEDQRAAALRFFRARLHALVG
jgi:hypothetical protein